MHALVLLPPLSVFLCRFQRFVFEGDGHVCEVGSRTLLEMVSFCVCVPAVDISFLFFLSEFLFRNTNWYFAGGLVSPLHIGKVAHLAEFGAAPVQYPLLDVPPSDAASRAPALPLHWGFALLCSRLSQRCAGHWRFSSCVPGLAVLYCNCSFSCCWGEADGSRSTRTEMMQRRQQ